ncbi:M56 family peptidase [Candidatus Parcubacteria bacterium]|nr:MAG: M56 family peptidase [Candidatus Parcubacteria bacterium]
MISPLQKKARLIFLEALSAALFFAAAAAVFSIIIFPKFWLVWESLMHRLEVLCGCGNHFTFSHHPFIFSLIILAGIIIPSALAVIFFRAFRIYSSTAKYIKVSTSRKRRPISRKLDQEAKKLGLENRIIEINGGKPVIFSFGYFHPSICISSILADKLEAEELRAVLLHEKHHLKNHEPLKILAVKVISLLPLWGIKELGLEYLAMSEIIADGMATENFQNKRPLARALCKYLKLNEAAIKKHLAISYFSPTAERINRLLDGQEHIRNKFRFKLLVTFFLLVLSYFTLNAVFGSEKYIHARESSASCQIMSHNVHSQCDEVVKEEQACQISYNQNFYR